MKTPIVLSVIHVVAFLFLFAARVVPNAAGNGIVALGLCVEFPGYLVANVLKLGGIPWLLFIFFFNAFAYFGGGLLMDKATRAPRS